jgi:cardiolipin synthase A/B
MQSPATSINKNLQHHLEGILGIPFTSGNSIQPLRNGNQIFPAMLDAINEAESSIIFTTYVYWKGDIAIQFAHALANKARQGVSVDILLDSYGAKLIQQKLIDLMQEAGVNIRWFRPLSSFRLHLLDNRTHRKILVVDGKLGFTGGVGIASEWNGDARNKNEWRDTHFKIRGPAVEGLRGAFFANWAETGDIDIILNREPIVPFKKGDALIQVIRSTTSAGWSDIVTLFHALISATKYSLKISTAYFVVSETMQALLIACAKRGVEIDILIPGEHTNQQLSKIAGQEMFSDLLEAGIRIYQYQPTMLHTKIIIVDDELVCIGSPNFNQRSTAKDEEIALCVISNDLIESLNNDFDDDIQSAEPYDLERWQNRSYWQRMKEYSAKLFKRQL